MRVNAEEDRSEHCDKWQAAQRAVLAFGARWARANQLLADGDWLDADFAVGSVPLHQAVSQRKERVVDAHTDMLAGMEASAALANQNGAGEYALPVIALDTQPFALAVTTVAGSPLSLLMCHGLNSLIRR
jgi:hypothetical protein